MDPGHDDGAVRGAEIHLSAQGSLRTLIGYTRRVVWTDELIPAHDGRCTCGSGSSDYSTHWCG